jgi:prepilin-type N-terminal cleavage/methylation domain-containing protein
MRRRIDGHHGFTLLESLLAITILAISIMALTVPFQAGAQAELEDGRRTLAACLAVEMIEEVLSKEYSDPQGDSMTEYSRSAFDDIHDYDGYYEVAGEVRDVVGTPIADPVANGLSRRVEVDEVHVAGQSMSDPATVSRVTVTVDYDGQPIQTVSRLIYADR